MLANQKRYSSLCALCFWTFWIFLALRAAFKQPFPLAPHMLYGRGKPPVQTYVKRPEYPFNLIYFCNYMPILDLKLVKCQQKTGRFMEGSENTCLEHPTGWQLTGDSTVIGRGSPRDLYRGYYRIGSGTRSCKKTLSLHSDLLHFSQFHSFFGNRGYKLISRNAELSSL